MNNKEERLTSKKVRDILEEIKRLKEELRSMRDNDKNLEWNKW